MQQERLGEGRQQGRDAARVVDVGMAVDDGIQTGTGVAGQQGQQELLPRVPGAGHAACGIHQQGLAVRQAQQDGLGLSHIRDRNLQPRHQTMVQAQGRARTGQQQTADEQAFPRRRQAGTSGPQGQCQKKAGHGGQGRPVGAQDRGATEPALGLEEEQPVHQPLAGQGHHLQYQSGRRIETAQAEAQPQEGPGQDKGPQDGQPEDIEQEPEPAVVEQQQGKGQQGQLDEEGDQQDAGQ